MLQVIGLGLGRGPLCSDLSPTQYLLLLNLPITTAEAGNAGSAPPAGLPLCENAVNLLHLPGSECGLVTSVKNIRLADLRVGCWCTFCVQVQCTLGRGPWTLAGYTQQETCIIHLAQALHHLVHHPSTACGCTVKLQPAACASRQEQVPARGGLGFRV